MGGRRPKPTNLKVLAGNPGKRPLPKNEPKPEIKIPEPPEHIDGIALEEWNRIAPELFKLNLLTEIDRAALGAYCSAYQMWIQAETAIKEHDATVPSPRGGMRQSPYVRIASQSKDIMRKFLLEFGMTPASRSRVSTVKGVEKKDNVWADF